MTAALAEPAPPPPLRFRDVFNPGDWPEVDRETHLIEGIVSTTLTVVAADPAVGKTHLAVGIAAALLNGDAEFLGQRITTSLESVAFLSTDADGANSIRRRIAPLLYNIGRGRVHTMDYPLDRDFDWDEFADVVSDVGAELLIVDNIPGVVDDVNDFAEVKRVTRSLLRLTEAGTAVLVLTHTAKPGATGPAQGVNAPIGTRYWTIPARLKGSLTSRTGGEQRKLFKGYNNDGEFVRIEARLEVQDNGAPVWAPWDESPDKAVTVEPMPARVVRAVSWDDHLAARVLAEQPPETTQQGLATRYAADAERAENTVRLNLARLVRRDGDRWVPVAGHGC